MFPLVSRDVSLFLSLYPPHTFTPLCVLPFIHPLPVFFFMFGATCRSAARFIDVSNLFSPQNLLRLSLICGGRQPAYDDVARLTSLSRCGGQGQL